MSATLSLSISTYSPSCSLPITALLPLPGPAPPVLWLVTASCAGASSRASRDSEGLPDPLGARNAAGLRRRRPGDRPARVPLCVPRIKARFAKERCVPPPRYVTRKIIACRCEWHTRPTAHLRAPPTTSENVALLRSGRLGLRRGNHKTCRRRLAGGIIIFLCT